MANNLRSFPLRFPHANPNIQNIFAALDTLFFGPTNSLSENTSNLAEHARSSIEKRFLRFQNFTNKQDHGPSGASALRERMEDKSILWIPDGLSSLQPPPVSQAFAQLEAANSNKENNTTPSAASSLPKGSFTLLDHTRVSIPPPAGNRMSPHKLLSLLHNDVRTMVQDRAHELFINPINSTLSGRDNKNVQRSLFKHRVAALPGHFPHVLQACHRAGMLTWSRISRETPAQRKFRNAATLLLLCRCQISTQRSTYQLAETAECFRTRPSRPVPANPGLMEPNGGSFTGHSSVPLRCQRHCFTTFLCLLGCNIFSRWPKYPCMNYQWNYRPCSVTRLMNRLMPTKSSALSIRPYPWVGHGQY